MFFLLFKFCTTHYQLIHVKAYDLVQVVDDSSGITLLYHIFCCNMFVFACPIIARSQCWLFALAANIGICPRIQLPVSAQWSQRLCQSTRKNGA